LLDRLDLHVRVKSTEVATLLEARPVADSSTLGRSLREDFNRAGVYIVVLI